MVKRRVLLIIWVSVVFGPLLYLPIGQTYGSNEDITIEINLYDGEGVPWANHEISIINQRTDEVITVETGDDGKVTIVGSDFTEGLEDGDEIVLEENLFDGYISWIITNEIKSYIINGYFDMEYLLGTSPNSVVRAGEYYMTLASNGKTISYTAKVNRYTADSSCVTSGLMNYQYTVSVYYSVNDQRTQLPSGSSATCSEWKRTVTVDGTNTITWSTIYSSYPYSNSGSHQNPDRAYSSGSHTASGYQKMSDGYQSGGTYIELKQLGKMMFHKNFYVNVV